ncbi:MAG: transposase, partial [Hormoscilla sp. SP5CHS1]|nr:transposase [Hormoscilla sp. SP5CHS1]
MATGSTTSPKTFEQQVLSICQWHEQASELYKQGTHVVSTDEMTDIQALEREYPHQAMKPGQVERIEFNYIRHGTLSLITTWHVGQGQLLCPYLGPTRTEANLAAHIEQVIDTDPDACWCFIVDQLNTHKSETLVRLVAKRENLDLALGEKGKSGILQSMASRMAF